MKIYCYDPGKGKNILAGEYNPNLLTFTKKVTNKHYMVLEHGYGIQESVLQQLKNLGVDQINIKTKTGIRLSRLSDWFKRPIKDYGHGAQRFLEGKEW